MVISVLNQDGGDPVPKTGNIDVDVRSASGPLGGVFRFCVGAGRANKGLRADWQRQLREAQRDCAISSLVTKPSSLVSGAATILYVTLNDKAGPSGSVINLSSSSAAIVVPASVTVPAGSSVLEVPLTTKKSMPRRSLRSPKTVSRFASTTPCRRWAKNLAALD